MIIKTIITFRDGFKLIRTGSACHTCAGLKHNNQRPVLTQVFVDENTHVEQDLPIIYNRLRISMHPVQKCLTVNGEHLRTWYDNLRETLKFA